MRAREGREKWNTRQHNAVNNNNSNINNDNNHYYYHYLYLFTRMLTL